MRDHFFVVKEANTMSAKSKVDAGKKIGNEKKQGECGPTDMDAYNKIKERVKSEVNRWPSAYASGMLVMRYKSYMESRGRRAYHGDRDPSGGLTRWFEEKWRDLATGRACGSVRTRSYYPTCRPTVRVSAKTPKTASEYTKADIQKMIRLKQTMKEKKVNYNFSA